MNDNNGIDARKSKKNVSASILIVEDDEASRSGLAEFLELEGYKISEAAGIKDAFTFLDQKNREGKSVYDIDIIISDLKLPDGSGIDLLRYINHTNINNLENGDPGTAKNKIDVVITTGYSSVKSAVEAIKLGAYDYITKPVNLDELSLIIKRIVSNKRLIDEINLLKTRLDERFNFGNLVTSSKKMIDVVNTACTVAGTNSTVLIEGESGTGKELMADIIVNNGNRKNKPFIKVNCAALSESILESELFGHEKGAYTGADSLYKGRFEIADGGTIFLDEIGEIPLKTQSKILRVLQEKEFERVGGNKTLKVDIRIIAASQDIEGKVRSGDFRQDLYYRLNVINLKLIPLRERREDMPLLIKRFLSGFNKETNKNIQGLNRRALDLLLNYDYPGNVRELKNIVEFMTAVSNNETEYLDESMLPNYIKKKYAVSSVSGGMPNKDDVPSRGGMPESVSVAGDSTDGSGFENYIKIPLGLTLEDAENIIIQKTLEINGYNKAKTARDLNIGLKTVYRKLANKI